HLSRSSTIGTRVAQPPHRQPESTSETSAGHSITWLRGSAPRTRVRCDALGRALSARGLRDAAPPSAGPGPPLRGLKSSAVFRTTDIFQRPRSVLPLRRWLPTP